MSTTPSAIGADVGPAAGDRPGLRLGSVAGVPVYVSASWFVIAAIIVVTFGPDVAAVLPRLGQGAAYLVAFAYALLLVVSVLCHEAAHAVVARACGYSVQRVVVNLWGGHTAFSTPAPTPGRSALVSVSGPVANALLAGVGWAVLPFAKGGVPGLLLFAWTFSNALVAVFNLLPGLPLDGGFLVEALVWRVTGRRSAGLVAAGWGGRIVTAVALIWLVLLPLVQGRQLSLWSVAWFAFLGAFLWSGASSAVAAGRSVAVFERVSLAQVVRPVAAVALGASAEAIAGLAARAPGGAGLPVLVDEAGRAVGLVDPTAYARVDAHSLGAVAAGSLLLRQPAGWLLPAPADTGGTIAPYLAAVAEMPYGVVVFTDALGRPVGALTSGDVERAASSGVGGGT